MVSYIILLPLFFHERDLAATRLTSARWFLPREGNDIIHMIEGEWQLCRQ
jgi:hypothetical protein